MGKEREGRWYYIRVGRKMGEGGNFRRVKRGEVAEVECLAREGAMRIRLSEQ
jgi:hypothetical protein